MSGEPEQEYFSDGISEDLITALSKLRWFLVIARNSSFIYKGKSVHLRQVAEELGVRYVVEGSVRRSNDRIRSFAKRTASKNNRQGIKPMIRFLSALILVISQLSTTVIAQDFTREQLTERAIHRRAVEAVIWGMPAVNYERMLQAAIDNSAKLNQVVYWSKPVNWKNQTLTPNPDTIYLMPFFSTKDVGAVVIEIPPADEGSITGTIMNCWQGTTCRVLAVTDIKYTVILIPHSG